MKLNGVFGLFCLTLLFSCNSGKNRLDINTRDIQVPDIKIHRYDLDLFHVSGGNLKDGLEQLKPAYRFFLDADLNDTVKLMEMKAYLENPRNIDFYTAVQNKFKDLSKLEKDLTEAFRHYLYYYPNARIPRVYAYISGGDYDYPVQFADSVLLIGFDNYLGKDCKIYVSDGIPQYRLDKMTPDNMVPDGMMVLARISQSGHFPGNALLDHMVEEGKLLYFTEAMAPLTNPRFIIGYNAAQTDWIVKNEAHVWAAIIENRLLYSTDGQTIRTFMADGPFTAEFSKEAPGRLGAWIGWQIVKQFMANQEDVSLQQLMLEHDAQKILTASKYKPEK